LSRKNGRDVHGYTLIFFRDETRINEKSLRSIQMEILNKDVLEATTKKFSEDLIEPVKFIHFTQEPSRLVLPEHLKGQECLLCKETKQLYQEISNLSGKIELEIYDFVADEEKKMEYKIDKIPSLTIQGKENYGIRFFGIPSGYEYSSLIEAIIDVSKGKTNLSPDTLEAIETIKKDIHIQVFVTPTCPYCTTAVRLGHQFALASPKITSDMVESTEFPHLAHKYNVSGVPKTVINESITIEGAVAENVFLEHVLKAAES
jgi:glutaredoxin-like protein